MSLFKHVGQRPAKYWYTVAVQVSLERNCWDQNEKWIVNESIQRVDDLPLEEKSQVYCLFRKKTKSVSLRNTALRTKVATPDREETGSVGWREQLSFSATLYSSKVETFVTEFLPKPFVFEVRVKKPSNPSEIQTWSAEVDLSHFANVKCTIFLPLHRNSIRQGASDVTPVLTFQIESVPDVWREDSSRASDFSVMEPDTENGEEKSIERDGEFTMNSDDLPSEGREVSDELAKATEGLLARRPSDLMSKSSIRDGDDAILRRARLFQRHKVVNALGTYDIDAAKGEQQNKAVDDVFGLPPVRRYEVGAERPVERNEGEKLEDHRFDPQLLVRSRKHLQNCKSSLRSIVFPSCCRTGRRLKSDVERN